MPRLLLCIVLLKIQSMATKNNMGDRKQPWRTPLLTLNHSSYEGTTGEILVEKFDDADNLLWALVGWQDTP